MLDEQLIRGLFEEAMRRSGVVGAQLSVIRDGEQVSCAGGFADAAQRRPMTAGTLMQIGSVTKVFNALIVTGLADEGVLNLDEPLATYLPSLETADTALARTLTFRHVLSMSSGLDNGPYVYPGTGDDALARYVDGLGTLPHHFAPGTQFGYSNAGICIAGQAAAWAARRSWESMLRDRILDPADLDQSALLSSDLDGHEVSAGHTLAPDGSVTDVVQPVFDEVRGRAPSGPSLALSAAHLARFGRIFLGRGTADNGVRIVPERVVETMTTPQIATPVRKYGDAWCLGPCTGLWDGARVWGHPGSTSTSVSSLYWIPAHNGVIAFVVNTPDATAEFAEVVFGDIARAAFGVGRPPLDVRQPARTDPQRYLGVFEDLGTRVEITPGDGNALRMRVAPKLIPNERGGGRSEQDAVLTPLGPDRFLVTQANGRDGKRGVADTAFFGSDDDGRATNALNGVFPMSRV